MNKIIETGSRIILHTAMTDREFAQANMMQHMKAEGYVAKEADGGSFEFSKWFFEDTATDESGEFSLSGPGFSGITAYQILKEVEDACKDTEICTKPNQTQLDAWKKIFRIIKAMKAAELEHITLPDSGAIGIIYADDGSILFLPELLVTRSIAMRSQKEAAEYTESWRQPILPIEQMPSFSAAVMIYTIITGRRPFNADSPEALTEDFLDCYFVPAEYVCTISKENAEILDTALKGKIKFRPSLKRLLSIFKEDISEVYLPETKTAKKEAKDKANAKLISRTKRSRYIRRHFTQIAIAVLSVVIAAVITISIVNTELSRPTTKGLTSIQVVESFYTSMHSLQTESLDECISKDAGKDVKSIVTNIYVTSKMQTAQGLRFFTPAQWITVGTPDRSSLFGITHLKINGVETAVNADWLANNKKIPLDVQKGSKESFTVDYYLVLTEDPENITILEYKDSVELTFVKDKWIITKLDRNGIESKCNRAAFIQDLSEDKTESYPWFPSQQDFDTAKSEIAAQAAF